MVPIRIPQGEAVLPTLLPQRGSMLLRKKEEPWHSPRMPGLYAAQRDVRGPTSSHAQYRLQSWREHGRTKKGEGPAVSCRAGCQGLGSLGLETAWLPNNGSHRHI